MPVPTGPGISGFIKSRPQLSMTVNNDPRFSAWVGIPQTRVDENGVLQELEPLETRMVMFGASAQRAHEKFRRGDNIVAFGEPKEYTANRDGQQVTEEYFHASHLGHDNNVTTYTVHRGPERYPAERDGMQREAARQESVARENAQQQAAGQQPVGQQAPAQPAPAQQAPAPQQQAQQAPVSQQPAQAAAAQSVPAQQAAPQQAAPQQPVAPQPATSPPQAAPAQQQAPPSAPTQAAPPAPDAGPPAGQQPQAGQAPAGDPVAEVLAQRQNEVAAEPAPARAEPPGYEAMSR
ncbi:MAG: single-stranded DNA-binding protein [Brevibacterium aurantiacum]|uniref:single-stranded DNA-binding protein n=1 Tax=Brevibacterium aurantiacum TaxID=273384 RepID=UPI003F92B5B4